MRYNQLMTIQEFVTELSKQPNITKSKLEDEKRKYLKRNSQIESLRSSALLEEYRELVKKEKIIKNKNLEKALRLKHIRSSSGVSVVTVLTKPWPCPGKCIYCPTLVNMPKSYLSSEPAASRAKQNDFDPYKQVSTRLQQYYNTGHPVDKIELIILGGSFNAYPKDYQEWFVSECFRAANEFIFVGTSLDLSAAEGGKTRKDTPASQERTARELPLQQKINETASSRVVFLSVETRPDLITEEEAWWFRQLGITKVELGVQSLDNAVLKKCKRGHKVEQTAKATKILKSFGFKICYHIMPGLPGSTPSKDLQTFKTLFSDPRFQPDMLKIYPTSVLPGTELEAWYKAGKYTPYTADQLVDLLVKIKEIIPCYTRINRLIRDIPEFEIIGGSKVTNLRQVVKEKMKLQGNVCKCIRCREVRHKVKDSGEVFLDRVEYQSSAGKEVFLQFVDGEDKLYGLLRLLLCNVETPCGAGTPALGVSGFETRRPTKVGLQRASTVKTALIRELHVFGQEVVLDANTDNAAQHKGLGKQLLAEAESIAKKAGYTKLAIISGVGVREYYRKLGYSLQNTYMVKEL